MESLQELSKNEDRRVILQTFTDVVSYYENNMTYCHDVGHHLAVFLYAYFRDLNQTLLHADEKWCGGGVYHGIIETHFATEKAIGKTNAADIDVKSICPSDPENPYTLARAECLHGIGHGVEVAHDYDVFAAVDSCKELDLHWERNRCYHGAFMENLLYHRDTQAGVFDDNDILFPCNVVDQEAAPACYSYHASYILGKKRSFSEAFEECDKITPEEFVKYCYAGLGRSRATTAIGDMEKAHRYCRNGLPEYQTYCYRSIAGALAKHKSVDMAFDFCKFLPSRFKAECYDAVGVYVGLLHTQEERRTEECSKAESSEYFDICMKVRFDAME
jgi:hypothetical protein